jgi:hypothetical protein
MTPYMVSLVVPISFLVTLISKSMNVHRNLGFTRYFTKTTNFGVLSKVVLLPISGVVS